MLNTQLTNKADGGPSLGVVTGGIVRDPQSATLTTTIEGLWIRLKSSTAGKAFNEWRIADTSKAFTASKDIYVGVSSAGALFYDENSNGAAKPSNAYFETTYGVGAQLLAKVVTDGTRIISGGVSDLRQKAAVDLRSDDFTVSFASSEQGAGYWIAPLKCRLWKVQSTVQVALTNTDAGTITLAQGVNDKYTDMTNGVVTLALSSAIGTRASALPSASYIIDAGQAVRYTSAKTTAGGRTVTQFLYEPLGF